jgi:cytochrome c-type biogenesis protein CcmH/NrfG
MDEKTSDSRGVSHRKLFTTAIACLCIGFVAGVALTAYKTSGLSAIPGEDHAHTGPGMGSGGPSADDLEAMEAALRRRASENPADPAAWAQLGHLYFDAGRYDDAIQAYREALERDPENGNLWTDLGVMYRRSGNPQQALESFDRAIALAPRHEIARFNRGIVLLHDLDRTEDGIRAWEALAEINPVFSTGDGRTLDQLIQQYSNSSEPETTN